MTLSRTFSIVRRMPSEAIITPEADAAQACSNCDTASSASQIPKRASKKTEKNISIVMELLASEESYCAGLRLVLEHYLCSVIWVDFQDIQHLESFFECLKNIAQTSEELITGLRRLFEGEVPLHPDRIAADVAELFLQSVRAFHNYSTYINAYDETQRIYRRASEAPDSDMSTFLETTAAKLQKNGRRQSDLQSLLILPVQRLPRYSLLLTQLYNTCSGSDGSNMETLARLTQVIKTLDKILLLVNENKRHADNDRKVLQDIADETGISIDILANQYSRTLQKIFDKVSLSVESGSSAASAAQAPSTPRAAASKSKVKSASFTFLSPLDRKRSSSLANSLKQAFGKKQDKSSIAREKQPPLSSIVRSFSAYSLRDSRKAKEQNQGKIYLFSDMLIVVPSKHGNGSPQRSIVFPLHLLSMTQKDHHLLLQNRDSATKSDILDIRTDVSVQVSLNDSTRELLQWRRPAVGTASTTTLTRQGSTHALLSSTSAVWTAREGRLRRSERDEEKKKTLRFKAEFIPIKG